MKEEVQYKWRIKWCGRWTTSHFCSESAIRREHPEAVIIPGSERVIMVLDTPDELRRQMCPAMGPK